jgi:hypothetical protein
MILHVLCQPAGIGRSPLDDVDALEPEFNSAFSRALSASIGSSVKSTLMPVAFSKAGATSSTRHQCHGPLSPTNTSLSGLL